jgi:aspartate/methionine/tyrosine aminotransferase
MHIKTSSRLDVVSTYYFADKLRQIAAMQAAGKQVINLGVGSPDLPPHPEVIATLQSASAHPGNHGYQSYRGIPELRQAFAKWYESFYSFLPDAEHEVLPLMGSKEGIMHLSMAYLEAGDEVLIPNPGYPTYAAAAKLAGAQVRYYDLKASASWLPDLEALAQTDLTKVKLMWINYPHMPSGACASENDLAALIAFAERHGILLCHDNPYNAILNPAPLSILGLPGAMKVAVELNSLSKTFNMAGWRIGVMVGRKDLIDNVLKFKSNMDSGMFKPLQLAAVKALQLGPEWMAQVNAVYSSRRALALAILHKLGCRVGPGQCGLFLWAEIPEEIAQAEDLTEKLLHEAGIFIAPGHIFGSNGRRYVRISLCANEYQLRAALRQLEPLQNTST